MGDYVDNDKELLIRLEGKVDAILDRMKDIPKLEERVRSLEQQAVHIDGIRQDIEALESKSNTWSILNSIGIFAAGLLGFWGK
jgi:hypothetical protein